MSERDYTKAPFDFDLPDEPLEADWLDPFLDSAPLQQGITEKRPGDFFRDIKHGNTAAFPTASKGTQNSNPKTPIRYGKLNWNNSF